MVRPGAQFKSLTIGILSDTHGRVLPSVLKTLQGVDHIIHAGDVGAPEVLATLGELAPVTAVRGNCDYGSWAQELPETAVLQLGPAFFLVAHMPARAASLLRTTTLSASGVVVVSGHTHRPHVERQEEVLFVNPGTAGSSRFTWSRTLALAVISETGYVEARILTVA